MAKSTFPILGNCSEVDHCLFCDWTNSKNCPYKSLAHKNLGKQFPDRKIPNFPFRSLLSFLVWHIFCLSMICWSVLGPLLPPEVRGKTTSTGAQWSEKTTVVVGVAPPTWPQGAKISPFHNPFHTKLNKPPKLYIWLRATHCHFPELFCGTITGLRFSIC